MPKSTKCGSGANKHVASQHQWIAKRLYVMAASACRGWPAQRLADGAALKNISTTALRNEQEVQTSRVCQHLWPAIHENHDVKQVEVRPACSAYGRQALPVQLVRCHAALPPLNCILRVALEPQARSARFLDSSLDRRRARDALEVVVVGVRAHELAERRVGRGPQLVCVPNPARPAYHCASRSSKMLKREVRSYQH
jgi:hypothetical protein